jgi:polyisoprenoid-binding protein YceI
MDHRIGAPGKVALLITSLCLTSAGLWAQQCQAETYTFDTRSTEVRFTYQFGLLPQSGRFAEVKGSVEFNERAPERSRVDAVINAASLTAGDPMVESELKGESFFNVAVQPEIRFKSRAVKATTKNRAELIGELTMNGVTRPVTLQVMFYSKGASLPAIDGRQVTAGGPFFTATTRINRSLFNMTAYRMLVADEIEIQIGAPLRKK